MLNDIRNSKLGLFLRFGIVAVTIVASTEAFARGEGGGGGGGEGGSGEPPSLSTAPVLTPQIRGRNVPVFTEVPNCKLEMRRMRFC